MPSLRLLAIQIVFVLSLTHALPAQIPERYLQPGDSVFGQLADDQDVDVFGFEAFAGTTFDARLKTDGFSGRIELFDLTTEQRLDPGSVDRLKKVALPSTGAYALRVVGESGGFGAYALKTKAKEPREVKGATVELSVGAAGTIEVEFAGRPGALLSGVIQPGRDSFATPSAMIAIERPDGGAALLPVTSVRGTRVQFQDMELEVFGTHRLVVTNHGDAGTLRIQLKIKAPRSKSKKADAALALVVDPVATPTNASTVRLTGTTSRANATILVTGGASRVEGRSDGRCAFDVDVPLATNRLNRLHVIETTAFGYCGPAYTVVVVHDLEAPFLRIDHPRSGARTARSSVTVAGRVSDRLSGLQDLGIFVNGVRATIMHGPDGVGTFEARDVPLPLGATTILDASARDRFTNTGIDVRPFEHVQPSGSYLEIVSGDQQSAVVGALLPQPIVVLARSADGSARANQLVTVEVAAGDGFVRATLGSTDERVVQLTTDAAGMASFYWTLGSTAGLSNQRVHVLAGGFELDETVLASAMPGVPMRLVVHGPGELVAETGAPASERARVCLVDGRNGIAGVPIAFTVTAGDATLGEASARSLEVFTDADGIAAVSVHGGSAAGTSRIMATYSGNTSGPVEVRLRTLERGQGGTHVAGLVRDAAGRVLEHATCALTTKGGATVTTLSDAEGRFTFANLDAYGPAELFVDGASVVAASGTPVALQSYGTERRAELVLGNRTTELTEVRLTRLDPQHRVANYDGSTKLTLTIGSVADLSIEIAAGSMRDGAGDLVSPGNTIDVGLDLANVDDLGDAWPSGYAPILAWDLTPRGASFDVSAALSIANVVGAPAGARLAVLGYDARNQRFEVVGTATVTQDGRSIASDDLSGVRFGGPGAVALQFSEVATVTHDGAQGIEDVFQADLGLRTADPTSGLARHELCVVQAARSVAGQDAFQLAVMRAYGDRIARRGRSVDGVASTLGSWTPQNDLSENDLVSVLAGLGHHVPFDVLPYRVQRHASWNDADDARLAEIVASCLATNADVSSWLRGIAATFVRVDATYQRELLQQLRTWIALPGDATPPGDLPVLTTSGLPSPIVAGLNDLGPLRVDTGGVTFLDVQDTLQLVVTRREANGTVTDVTAGSLGTFYFPLTGNAAVSVSTDGLVTVNTTPSPLAALHARFFVVVRNGSDVAIAQLAIRGNDLDQDLLADAFETQVGLDPGTRNAGDADQDLDGLTDLVECLLGTDPTDPDTDGDGITDFDEVAQGSDPRDVNDTHGRVREGAFVRVGPVETRADALGGFSLTGVPAPRVHRVNVVSLTPTGFAEGFSDFFVATPLQTTAVDVIDFAPPTVGRPASLQLGIADPTFTSLLVTRPTQAIATTGSGALADVTGEASGTSYGTSDASVATIDSDGVVQAIGDGVATLTATRDGLTATLTVTVVTTSPTTNVIGRAVLGDGTPLVGAAVHTVTGSGTVTGQDGSFAIAGVPANDPVIDVVVTTRSGAAFLTGYVDDATMRPGAITDVGEIVCASFAIPNEITVFDSVDETVTSYSTDGFPRIMAQSIGLGVTATAMDVDGALWACAGETLAKIRQGGIARILHGRTFPGSALRFVVVAPDRTLFVGDEARGGLWHLNSAGYPLGFFATAHVSPSGVAIALDGMASQGYVVWVASLDAMSGNATVQKVDPATMQAMLAIPYTGELVRGIAVDPTGNLWVPVDVAGAAVEDRLDGFQSDGTPIMGAGVTCSFSGTAMQQAVVVPTGGVFITGGSDAQSPGGAARLFGYEPPTLGAASWDLNGTSTGAEPRGCWLDGEGHVWASLLGAGTYFRFDRFTQATSTPGGSTAPVNVGDPCGYLLAYLIFPNEDFDEDGVANRMELENGSNPFRP